MANGFVYVLLNPAIPGMVKIGLTEETSEARARHLSSATGVPRAFIVLYDVLVSDVKNAEKDLHVLFSDYRVEKRREFFYVPPKVAIGALIDIGRKYPVDAVPLTAIDDVLSMLKIRFPNYLDPNIVSVHVVTVPGSCFLKVGRILNGIREYSEEDIPLDGLKAPEIVTPDVVKYNTRLLASLDEYDWIMIADLFPKEIAREIAKEWEMPGGKLNNRQV